MSPSIPFFWYLITLIHLLLAVLVVITLPINNFQWLFLSFIQHSFAELWTHYTYKSKQEQRLIEKNKFEHYAHLRHIEKHSNDRNIKNLIFNYTR